MRTRQGHTNKGNKRRNSFEFKKTSDGDKMSSRDTHVGVFHKKGESRGGLTSCHRKTPFPRIPVEDPAILASLEEGDVVVFSIESGVKIVKNLGNIKNPEIFSKIAIYNKDIPYVFSKEALAEAEGGYVPKPDGRDDYRDLSLVTIDGEDAKDFDDAVYATPDTDPHNDGGWRLTVAIADVSYYVKPNSALDIEARLRGNSVYFPDTVVPMLPEALSNELCSLKPHVDRAALAVDMVVTKTGKLKSFRFKRALIKSAARLTYTQVQKFIDGDKNALPDGLDSSIVENLYGAYRALRSARNQRGSLNLDLPEYRIVFSDDQKIAGVRETRGQESNQLIEEFMVLANVCAAKALIAKEQATLFRVHDTPDEQRFTNLMAVLQAMYFSMPKKKNPTGHFFNDVLSKAKKQPFERLVNDLVLRCQAQAKYTPQNVGHFGLGLAHYSHFTSPIRRYADLLVHRGLVTSLNLGAEFELPGSGEFFDIGDHITNTEKKAAQAEREVKERMIAHYLVPFIGQNFPGTITGVSNAGVFATIDGMGVDGFIPMSALEGDYFTLDEEHHRLIGRRTKKIYQLGQPVTLRLLHSDPETVSIELSFMDKIAPQTQEPPKQKQPDERKKKSRKKGKRPRKVK